MSSFKERMKDFDRHKLEIERKLRKVLPILRGGTGPGRPQPERRTPPKRPQPLTKTYQFTPTIPANPYTGDVRWVETAPHPNARPPQEMINVTIEDDMREVFDNVDDLAAEEIAEEIYQVAEQTQNQDMENALARIEGRRPRQFRANTRSRQFSRSNLVPAPKKKRKVSAYQKRFGVELKKLKKLHPRTKIQNLMKKAHRRTRAALKKK